MKNILGIAFALLLAVSLFGCGNERSASPGGEAPRTEDQTPADDARQNGQADEEAVAVLVDAFGKKLQAVSLLAPQEIVSQAMLENYGDLVSPSLLEKWQNDPLHAPGRMTSSPWPDRIEIKAAEKISENAYRVTGEIIEITGTEQEKEKAAAKRPIVLTLKKIDGQWRIDDAALEAAEAPETADAIVYENAEYGFRFSLPDSWKGYTIAADKWEGLALEGPQSGEPLETGPIINIRHPEWTAENPRQDIPVMIFTVAQWDALQQGKFQVGAAPVGPSELGRNGEYVFALPARYNYAFPQGYEEVEEILKGRPLQPMETGRSEV